MSFTGRGEWGIATLSPGNFWKLHVTGLLEYWIAGVFNISPTIQHSINPIFQCSTPFPRHVLSQRRLRLLHIFRRNAEQLRNRLVIILFDGNVALAFEGGNAHEIFVNVDQLLLSGAGEAEAVHAVAMKRSLPMLKKFLRRRGPVHKAVAPFHFLAVERKHLISCCQWIETQFHPGEFGVIEA